MQQNVIDRQEIQKWVKRDIKIGETISATPTIEECKDFPYIPVWDDYKEDKKNALEKVFKIMDSENVEKIKDILIRDEHLKLSKRFCMFIEKNVNEDFFNNQQGRKIVGREEFSVALANAYNSRSKYVHTPEIVLS